MTITSPLSILSDAQLVAEVTRLVAQERSATAELIRSLIELDVRRLYLAEGCSSLFTYCTEVLHLSEHAALGRIEVARAARRLPGILDRLLDGSVTVTNARMLAPHLTRENHDTLLDAVRHKSKREVERIVAELRPQPDVPAVIRRLPAAKPVTTPAVDPTAPPATEPAGAAPAPLVLPTAVPDLASDTATRTLPSAPARRAIIAPLTPERYRLQLTVSREAHDNLRRAQDLLRHIIPGGDPAAIIERALGILVQQLEKAKCAATPQPRQTVPSSSARHIPAIVRREVWKRDEGRCAFVGTRGRCKERGFLEFHHVVPYAAGGTASAGNIQLRCRAHNVFEAELFFGAEAVRERSPSWG